MSILEYLRNKKRVINTKKNDDENVYITIYDDIDQNYPSSDVFKNAYELLANGTVESLEEGIIVYIGMQDDLEYVKTLKVEDGINIVLRVKEKNNVSKR